MRTRAGVVGALVLAVALASTTAVAAPSAATDRKRPTTGSLGPRPSDTPTTAGGNDADQTPDTVDRGTRIDLVSQTSAVAGAQPFAIESVIEDPPAGGEVSVELHQAVTDRDAFRQTLFGVGLGDVAARAPAIELPRLAPDQVPASALFLFDGTAVAQPGLISLDGELAPGVYPVEVTVTDQDGTEVANLVSHLVRRPDDPDRSPLRVALSLPVDAAPGISPSGEIDPDPAAERRASVVAGALTRHPGLALTVDATPETIESLAETGGAAAGTLDELAGALGNRELIDRPYVRLPVDTWIRNGLGTELDRQIERGTAVLTEQLGTPDPATWMSAGPVGADAAAGLFQRGIRRFVVPGTSLAGQETTAGQETAAGEGTTAREGITAPFGLASPAVPPVAAMASDVSLSSGFDRTDDQELDGHLLLAELTLVDLGRSGDDPAGVVFGPPPDWEPRAEALEILLDGLATNPALRPTTIDDLFAEVPEARTAEGEPVRLRLSGLPPADLGTFPGRVTETRSRLVSYSQLVGPDSPDTALWKRLLLVAGSKALDAEARDGFLTTVETGIARNLEAIGAPTSQTVTLTAREASVPLTLRNDLDQPVQVMLELESSTVLEFPGGTRVPVTIQPGTDSIRLRVRAKSPGDVALRINVRSPDGQLALADTLITVRSTAVSGIGVVLSIGAALFLAVWWLRHWRRNRHQPRPATR